MRIQPRQQLLNVWKSLISVCYQDGEWQWGGRDGSNSISDAEQLLCLLYPATEINAIALDRPDDMAEDVKVVLSSMGGPTRIGEVVVQVLEEYIERYTDADDEPVFTAGSYLRADSGGELTEKQHAVEVVDSYSKSLTLCLSALGFLRVFKTFVQAQTYDRARALADRIGALTTKISTRLTAAMVGLLRSFVVNTMSPTSPAGQAIVGMLNQTGQPAKPMVDSLIRALEPVRTRLRGDSSFASVNNPDSWVEDMLFECGWTWGVAREAELIAFASGRIATQPGVADPRPYLYFTVVALDGISDLLSQRTRQLDLLDEGQRSLAEALRTRWHLTQLYWSTVARFGTGRWPLEDIPWRTSDGEESDYYTLGVSAVLIEDLDNRTAGDHDLTRAIAIFDELAQRGRITRRVTKDDPAVAMHVPGVRMSLAGSEDVDNGTCLSLMASDYAPVLLKRTLQAARLSGDISARDRLMELAKSVMEHLDSRMIKQGPAAGLWDDAARVFAGADNPPPERPSWYLTERVIECLVTADRTFRSSPLRPTALVSDAVALLVEAEHLLNRELLDVSYVDLAGNLKVLATIELYLDRARELIGEKPGTAVVLAMRALDRLDELAYADQDAMRSF